jgi:hypothetical protein
MMAALLVVLAALRPTVQTPVAQADLGSPGGLAVLPTAIPPIPGVIDQQLPAIIGTGQYAIVAVFCAPPPIGGPALPLVAGPCPGGGNSGVDPTAMFGPVTFDLTRLYPTSGAPMAKFDASGSTHAVVTDNSGADKDVAMGVIAIKVNAAAATTGGTQGVNEILQVTATDALGDVRTQQLVIVDTILAWGPTGAVSTASQEQPAFISYHCDVLGRAAVWAGFPAIPGTPAALAEAVAGDADGQQGLDDMYDGLYGPNAFLLVGPGAGYGSNPVVIGDIDLPDVWCGGNTGALFDDFVQFQTDKGIFSVDPVAVQQQIGAAQAAANVPPVFWPPMLDYDCGEGQTIDTFDIDALSVWGAFIPLAPFGNYEGGCDADGWRNGVVTTMLLGNGQVGVATIKAQQGGGLTTPRTINVTFEGVGALSLFITAPAALGLTGGDFTVALVDQDGRPVGDESLQCTVDPAGGALVILNQTGTTGSVTSSSPGQVTFTLVPTGISVVAGQELTLTCVLDRDHSIKATATVALSSTPNLEAVDLVEGCNPIAATWADGTAIATVAGAVAPAEAIWKFDPATSTWKGYSPSAPAAVNDLVDVNRLDAIFICVNAAATASRPVI